jgi:hypothetical protein
MLQEKGRLITVGRLAVTGAERMRNPGVVTDTWKSLREYGTVSQSDIGFDCVRPRL